ncbi:MAG: PAS domain S-box protein [Candidatus Hydrogenedentes bacterium]|nr:PAS domain S-box protein [Candidatus Hydrogenedentota bacterium]
MGMTTAKTGKSSSPAPDRSTSAARKSGDLLREIEVLRARLEEAEATIQAIQSGGVDALVVSGPDGERVFALEGADYPYRVILDVLNEGVVTLGANGAILSCNNRFVTFIGMTSERILGRPLADFITQEDAPRLSAFLSEVAAESGIITICLARADGTTMPANLSAAAFEVGGLHALCVVVTNLSEVFDAAKTRMWLASIVETSSDAIISNALDGTILTWNAAAERIYGFSAEEAVGQPISIIVPRNRISDVAMFTEQTRLGQQIKGYETSQITKSGIAIHVALTISPLMDAAGKTNGISIIARDITERKKAQAELEEHRHHLEELVEQRTLELSVKTSDLQSANEQLQSANEQLQSANEQLHEQGEEMAEANELLREKSETLRRSEERLRLALQAVKMATWEWNIPDNEMTWNDECYREFGYEVGSVKPSYEAWINRVHADDRVALEEAFHAAMSEGWEYSTEFRTRWPDGTVHWLWALGGFDCDDSGKAVRSFSMLLDITEKKDTELRVQKLNEVLQQHSAALEEINEELDSYSHSVSHDLRTPLRLTNKIAHLLLQEHGAQLPHGAVEKVRMILDSTHQMGKLIEDLLAFSRLSREPMKKRRVDIGRLAQEALEELQDERQGRDVEVVIDELPPCIADRALLKQVYLNVLANALKFTRQRERAEIHVGCAQLDGETIYFVRDNGMGFDMSHAESMFLAFHRLHRSQDVEGSGVGLALAKRIVERHGGRIWAEGQTDHGATFYFTLGE